MENGRWRAKAKFQIPNLQAPEKHQPESVVWGTELKSREKAQKTQKRMTGSQGRGVAVPVICSLRERFPQNYRGPQPGPV
jgi:hypothetical protein